MTARDFLHRAGPSSAANRHATAISPRGTQTETLSLRDQLDAAREEIARLVERSEETEREIRALREAVAARDSFLAIAGFELRNPMAAIALGVGNLLFQTRRARNNVPGWVGERLESLDQRTRNFVRRSTTLLDVARLTTRPLAVQRAPASFGAVAEAAVRELWQEAAAAACEIRLEIEPGLEGSWDGAALEQIAVTLVSNAIRFGAGAARREGDQAVLRVKDRGPGISDIDRDRIYESFDRAVASRECTGFGLSLWIARQLARAHGGEIAVETAPGEGSTFSVKLPMDARKGGPARRRRA
jgi:signal transduction histidine kinase